MYSDPVRSEDCETSRINAVTQWSASEASNVLQHVAHSPTAMVGSMVCDWFLEGGCSAYQTVVSYDSAGGGSEDGLPLHHTVFSLDDDGAHGTHNGGPLAGPQTLPPLHSQDGGRPSDTDRTPGPVGADHSLYDAVPPLI